MSEILLSDLKLHHLVGLGHCTEQWTVGLSRLKVDGAVLNLNNHIVVKLAVERLKLDVGLLCTVGIGRRIYESSPHHYASVGFQCAGHHVGSFGMSAIEVAWTRLTFGVGLDKETSEVGNQLVYFIGFGFPPCCNLGLQRVGGLQAAKLHGCGKIGRQIYFYTIGTEHIGNLGNLGKVLGAQYLG